MAASTIRAEQNRGPAGGAFERPTQKSSAILKRLWKYLCRYRWLLALAAVLSIGSNLLALAGPKLSGSAVDALGLGRGKVDFERVFHNVWQMIAFYTVSAALSYALAVLMIHLSRKVVFQLRKDAFEKLTTLPVRFFDTHQTGDVISVLSYDIDTISASLSNDVVQMLASALTVCVSFVMMLTISPRLLLVFVITIPMSVLFTKYRASRVRPLFRKRSRSLGQLNGFVEEFTAGQKTAKVYHREAVFLRRYDEQNGKAAEANYEAEYFASVTGPVVNFITNLSLALVSVFGALTYMAGGITLGGISSFVLYSRKFSGPINEFANIISELQAAFAAAERVFRLLDFPAEKPDEPDAYALQNPTGKVDAEHVRFGYEPGHVIIRDFSLHAAPGKVVAIVGPTGSGKTTLINLLMRFYDVDSGCIQMDGRDVRQMTRASLRGAFSMVLQETWLFYGTVYENIAYGKADVTREEVEAAAKAAHIHNPIMALPNGYDSLLLDNGTNISKGQKQLLTIARAMLLDSRMLILDEATSNVDLSIKRDTQQKTPKGSKRGMGDHMTPSAEFI